MKKIFSIFIFSFILFLAQVQGANLEFSRVLTLICQDGAQTVPANKIWKITSISSFSPNDSGITRFALNKNGSWTRPIILGSSFPFYLEEGISVAVEVDGNGNCYDNSYSGLSQGYVISIVEYTIVP